MVVKTKAGDVSGVCFINVFDDYKKAQRVAQFIIVNKLGDIVKVDTPITDIIGIADFADVPAGTANAIMDWYWRDAR